MLKKALGGVILVNRAVAIILTAKSTASGVLLNIYKTFT